jgi:hypothetical protein
VPRRLQLVAAFPILFLLMSCSHPSAISSDELDSIVRSSISFASEAVMSLDYLEEGRSTSTFSAGHFRYMASISLRHSRSMLRSTITMDRLKARAQRSSKTS